MQRLHMYITENVRLEILMDSFSFLYFLNSDKHFNLKLCVHAYAMIVHAMLKLPLSFSISFLCVFAQFDNLTK